jgi:isomerase DpgB
VTAPEPHARQSAEPRKGFTVSAIDVTTGPHAGLSLRVDSAQVLDAALVAALTALCDRLEAAAHDGEDAAPVGVLHLTGAPGAASVPGPGDGVDVHLVSKWERTLRRLERLDAATVAVVEGECSGVALDVLLATDHRVAAPDVELRLRTRPDGVWPGMAVYRLAAHAGAAAVRRTVLLGTPVPAAEALGLHLLHEVTDDPAAALETAVALYSAVPGREVSVRRRLLVDATSVSFEEALGSHLSACDRSLRRARAAGTAAR